MRYHVTHWLVLAHVPLCCNVLYLFFYLAFTIHMLYTRGIPGYFNPEDTTYGMSTIYLSSFRIIFGVRVEHKVLPCARSTIRNTRKVRQRRGITGNITHILETHRGMYITLGTSRMYFALRAYSCDYPRNPYNIEFSEFGMNFLKNPKKHCQILLHYLKALEKHLRRVRGAISLNNVILHALELLNSPCSTFVPFNFSWEFTHKALVFWLANIIIDWSCVYPYSFRIIFGVRVSNTRGSRQRRGIPEDITHILETPSGMYITLGTSATISRSAHQIAIIPEILLLFILPAS